MDTFPQHVVILACYSRGHGKFSPHERLVIVPIRRPSGVRWQHGLMNLLAKPSVLMTLQQLPKTIVQTVQSCNSVKAVLLKDAGRPGKCQHIPSKSLPTIPLHSNKLAWSACMALPVCKWLRSCMHQPPKPAIACLVILDIFMQCSSNIASSWTIGTASLQCCYSVV